MYELENYMELLQELNIWEMEEAFAEANSQHLIECDNIVYTTFGGFQ